jgi:predicted transcriptional regulator
MVSPVSVRFPDDVEGRLDRFLAENGRQRSSVIVEAVREWLLTRAHPRVRFVTTNTGERRAALLDGPEVWTVAEAWLQHDPADRTPAVVADAIGLDPAAVQAAVAYWADNRDEIDATLERHRLAQASALAAWERHQALLHAA